jgi:hypothetical protein
MSTDYLNYIIFHDTDGRTMVANAIAAASFQCSVADKFIGRGTRLALPARTPGKFRFA